MDITFIITDQQKAHEGVVRPFINFAKALQKKCHFWFLLLNCSDNFAVCMQKSGFEVVLLKNKTEAIQKLKQIKPNFLFTDDELGRLKLVQAIKKATNVKTVSYVQILYGSHSIADCFDLTSLNIKDRVLFALPKFMPFSLFRNRYIQSLKTFDLVIANSKITATLLHTLYNFGVSGVVYPSIDTELFQPNVQTTRKEITVYLGSHCGDTKQAFIKNIIANANRDGYFVNLFGNSRIARRIVGETGNSIVYHSNLSDVELSKLYSRSKLTVCPQKWEQFGLVPVESLSCGTPVLAFNCMGFQETMNQSSGWLANNDKEFMRMLHEALVENEKLPLQDLRDRVVSEFSIAASGSALEKILETYINQES